MNRLIIEIQGKLNQGICGEPYKTIYKHQQSKQPPSAFLTPKKFCLIQNYGQLHLYKDSRLEASLNQDSQLPLVRSTIVLLLGLSELSLDAVVSPLLKHKADLIQVEILKDKNKRIYLLVVFKFLNNSEEFFSNYQFRLMEDNSHLLCFFLKDVVYLKGVERDSSFDDVLLFGKVESDFKEWIQLPTCMDCLERIECRVSGVNYNYTGEQLSSKGSNCALCYTLANKQGVKCSDCKEEQDLWGCLICGQVGCGRYKNGHAQQHFMSRNHTLSIQLSTERVWYYLGDSFAHRIIKTQNNILNFPQSQPQDHCSNNKLESQQQLLWQYCIKISQELQKQRISYNRRLEEFEDNFKKQQKQLKEEIVKLEEKKKLKMKEAEVVKSKKARFEQRKKEIREEIAQEKELNKLLEKQIKCTKYVENQIIVNKKKELKELEERVAKMLAEIEFQ